MKIKRNTAQQNTPPHTNKTEKHKEQTNLTLTAEVGLEH
jgi:hypothetical protein